MYQGKKGPDDEELSLDIGRIGCESPERALVIISGTHGVEGFCGSACQTAWLKRQYQNRLLEDVAVYFMHALNPYGFAWSRRVTAENVDLNRNFLRSFNDDLPPNRLYAELEPLLNPTTLDEHELEQLPSALRDRLQTTEGVQAFKAAVGKGQYDYPHGIIFGGRGPTQCNLVLREFIGSLPRTIKVGVVLDFHTGLGAPSRHRSRTGGDALHPLAQAAPYSRLNEIVHPLSLGLKSTDFGNTWSVGCAIASDTQLMEEFKGDQAERGANRIGDCSPRPQGRSIAR